MWLLKSHSLPTSGRTGTSRIFENPFSEFCHQYDERLAQQKGRFRLPRIESTDGLASAATTEYGAPISGAPTPNVVPTTIGRSAA